MNSTKNRGKMLDFRIFRQIPAKMGLESQYLCGFPGGTVEMRRARRGVYERGQFLVIGAALP